MWFDALLLLECIDVVARAEQAIIDYEAIVLEQLLSAKPERVGLLEQNHPLERRFFVRHYRFPLSNAGGLWELWRSVGDGVPAVQALCNQRTNIDPCF